MADFDTGDVVRLGCVQKLDGLHDIVNVLHVQITAGGGLTFAAAALDFQEYCSALFTLIDLVVVDNVTADHISVKNVTQSTVWGNIAWGTYTGGQNIQDPLHSQVALLAYGRTHLSIVQISKYLALMSDVEILGGVWTVTARVAAQAFIDYHIVGQLMAGGLILQGCAYRPLPVRVVFATSGTTSEVPVIQRRRRLGRGS